MSEREQRYHLTYDATPHPEGIARAEVPDGRGACDVLVVHAIGCPEGGGLSIKVIGLDGRTGGDVTPQMLFTVWWMMAEHLTRQKGLGKSHIALAQSVLDRVRDALSRG